MTVRGRRLRQAAAKLGGGVLVCGGMLPLCYALFSLSRPGGAAFALVLGVAMAGLAYLGAVSAIGPSNRRLVAAPSPPAHASQPCGGRS